MILVRIATAHFPDDANKNASAAPPLAAITFSASTSAETDPRDRRAGGIARHDKAAVSGDGADGEIGIRRSLPCTNRSERAARATARHGRLAHRPLLAINA
jgi:hypothetical protein